MKSLPAQKTWVEIDLDALRRNLRALATVIGSERAIVLVVKSDSYGHGARSVVDIAAAEGISRFAVASVDEGEALRRFEVSGEILLLHPPLPFEMDRVIAAGITPTISSLANAQLYAAKAGADARPVHIEINTGMNRLGLDWPSGAELVAQIAAIPNLKIGGTFTHFRTGAPEDGDAVAEQMDRFNAVLTDLRKRGIDPGLTHAASSYVLTYHADTLCDAVRPGLLAYGGMRVERDKAVHAALASIRPVMHVRTRILHVRDVGTSEWVHYGTAYRTRRAMRLAVLPIGYGMGYLRHLTNTGAVLIAGQRAPIVGTVGMDLTIVDLDAIKEVKVGDIVTVLGADGDETITADDLAGWAGTIPYEFTCSLGSGLPRCVTGVESRPQAAPAKRVAAS